MRDCTICVAKTKTLIFAFVFAYAKSRFSHRGSYDNGQSHIYGINEIGFFVTAYSGGLLCSVKKYKGFGLLSKKKRKPKKGGPMVL